MNFGVALVMDLRVRVLDDYIDFYEDGTLRRCLMDEHGNRLKDAEGNPKTLRHKFAV